MSNSTVGYALIAYLCFCIAFGPTPQGKSFPHRMVWFLKNFTVWFWITLAAALVLIGLG